MSENVTSNCQSSVKKNNQSLNICHINVGGLYSKLNYGSIDEFCSKFDIICLSETKTELYGFEDTKLADYTTLFIPTENELHFFAAHGSCILVKKSLKQHISIKENTTSQFILWIKIDAAVLGFEFVLGAVYIPCQTSNYFNVDIFDDISDDICKFDCPVCLIGDFNSRTGELDDLFNNQDYIADLYGLTEIDTIPDFVRILQSNESFQRRNKDKTVNYSGKNLIELCKVHDLCIVNGRLGSDKNNGDFTCYTHNGASTIDYAIVSPGLLTKTYDFCVHDFDSLFSDTHCPISLAISSALEISDHSVDNCDVDLSNDVNVNHKNLSFKWNSDSPNIFLNSFSDVDYYDLINSIESLEREPSQSSVDSFCTELNNLFIEKAKDCNICKEKSNTKKNIKLDKKNKPWFDRECFNAREDYYKVKSRLKFVRSDERQSKVNAASKKFKNMIKMKKKTYLDNLHKKLRTLKSNNSKEYWAFLNKSSNNQTKHNMSIEMLKEHFKNISNVEPHNDVEFNIEMGNSSINEEINVEFTLDEIKSIIKKLKNGKACGIDHVRNEFLKFCPDQILSIFVKFFNIVLKTGIVPEVWCIGLILPLYKNKGDVNDPDNYRGITLLSCIGKLFTAIVNSRLTCYVDAVGALGDEQAGFRHTYSTIDHIFTLHVIIEFYLKKKNRLYCAFIDYKKAFDFVDRTSLWMKMISTGINGNILRVIHNLYDGAKSCVKLNGNVSGYFNCNVGVRQGENLSPLLFAIFLNDFEFSISRKYNGLSDLASDTSVLLSDEDVEVFIKLYTLLYADDTIVLAESDEELQKALNAVYDYCNNWQLSVNTTKTKIVIFSNHKVQDYPAFIFGHDLIEVVDDYTYLGTVFNYNGCFKKAIEKQLNQGKRAYYGLLSKLRKLHLPVDLSIELFNQLVVPVLTYGCEVWGFCDFNQMEILQRKFIKTVLGLNKCTPNAMVYGESGMYPLSCIVNMRMINFYMRLVNGKQTKLSCILYKVIRKQEEYLDSTYKWLDHIKHSLANIGMYNVWQFNGNGLSNGYVKNIVQSRTKILYQQYWLEMKSTHAYCSFYDLIKREMKMEKYLVDLNYQQRIAISKFRCRSNYLPISKSRFPTEDDYEESYICPLCRKNEIGDEYHYLFICPFFVDERREYLPEIPSHPDVHHMILLFDNNETDKLRSLSYFIKLVMAIFDHRDEWEVGT